MILQLEEPFGAYFYERAGRYLALVINAAAALGQKPPTIPNEFLRRFGDDVGGAGGAGAQTDLPRFGPRVGRVVLGDGPVARPARGHRDREADRPGVRKVTPPSAKKPALSRGRFFCHLTATIF